MSPFKIRKAEPDDTALIKEIIFSVLLEYKLSPDEQGKDSDLNDIEETYFNRGGFFGVLEDRNKRLVGTFGLCCVSKEIYELRKMYLIKEVRGLGCGKLILNYAIQLAKESNIKLIQLETISVLKEAILLYKKLGFKETKPKEINDRVDQAFELTVT
jgi:putative acetyltransferase